MRSIATLLPQLGCRFARINLLLQPPLPFIAGGMDPGVVNRAERHRELITDLERKTAGLRVADVVRMRWAPAANEAGLTRHKAQMFF